MQFNPPQTLSRISLMIGAAFEGDPDWPVSGINEIHMVGPGDLTFVDHPKYYDKALASAATTIIINKKMAPPPGKALVYSEDPFRDFVSLIKKFRPFEQASGMVSTNAIIGQDTIIQPGAFIGNHVVIGKNCLIHSNVSIYDHCVIGDHVIIHSGSVIGSDALYFKRRTEGYDKLESGGRVIIEDYAEIGSCCTIDRGSTGDTRIGKGSKLDNQIHIGHDTTIGQNCLFAAQVGVAGCTRIEDDVILWGQVGVQKDLTIGKGAIVLGQSGVTKSLEGGKTYVGFPARPAREVFKETALLKRLPDLFRKDKSRNQS